MNEYYPFVRKASNVKEIEDAQKKYLNHLPLFKLEVIKQIELDISMYLSFSEHLLDDYDFLAKYSKKSYFDRTTAKCLEVKCEDNVNKPSIYVVLEGANYAKYSFALLSID